MADWNELLISVTRRESTEAANCTVAVFLATDGTKQRVTRANRTFLVESPGAQDIDALKVWTVAIVAQIYATLATGPEFAQPVYYPISASTT